MRAGLAREDGPGTRYRERMIDGTPRRPLRSAERAASILEAAARVFARTGYAATSVDDVAAEAGITKLIVYRHFNSKRELYEAILEEVRARLDAGHGPRTLDGVEPEQAVSDAAGTLLARIRVARELPDAYRLLAVHAAREPEFAEYARGVQEQGIQKAEALLAALVEDPVLRRWAARVVSALTDEAVLTWLDVGEPGRDTEAARRLATTLGMMVGPMIASPEPPGSPDG